MLLQIKDPPPQDFLAPFFNFLRQSQRLYVIAVLAHPYFFLF
jgi:hypothetical protein